MNYGVKQEDILALSPYQAQCKHIHNKLKSNKLSDVKCTTVKSSEGTYLAVYHRLRKVSFKYIVCCSALKYLLFSPSSC